MRSSDREIRLLDLLPGNVNDDIRCTLRVVSLDLHPDYEALSYVWGDHVEDEDIEVSGKPMSITKNLYAGLRRLRNPTEKRTLWIDQLCINQWDMKEKAAQVALMRHIYKQCNRCVTWMGELSRDGCEVPISDAEAVLEFLRQVAGARSTPLCDLPVLFQQSDQGEAVRRAFEMFAMYGNPWWSRIWTVQEAIIPKSGELMWGPLSIPRDDVLTAARNLRDLQELPSLPKGFASCRYTYTELLRRLLYPVHGFNISKVDGPLSLLMRWRHREATDPRDKVYALVGLLPPKLIPSAQSCDYTISIPELFAMVTLDLVKFERSLRPLLAACEMPQVTAGIPTWAIDFACSNRIGQRQLKWWGHAHRYEMFAASKDSQLELREFPDNKSIGLTGFNIDEVLETSELLRIEAHVNVDSSQLRKPLLGCLRLIDRYRASASESLLYKDGFTWESAFCRTMVGDLIMDEFPLDRIHAYGQVKAQKKFGHLFEKLAIDTCNLRAHSSYTKIYLDSAPKILAAEERKRTLMRGLSKRTRLSRNCILRDVPQTNGDTIYHHIEFNELYESLVGMMENQTFFLTKSGYMGVGPPQVRRGDQVWVFNGGNVPFVMRKIEEEAEGCPQLTLIGDAYVHGIMDGEAMDDGPLAQSVFVH